MDTRKETDNVLYELPQTLAASGSHTLDEQILDLTMQGWAIQWTVQDRQAWRASVEAILAEAALANVQLAMAKGVLRSAASAVKAEFPGEGTAVEEAAACAEQAVWKLATRLLLGRVAVKAQASQPWAGLKVKVLCSSILFDAGKATST